MQQVPRLLDGQNVWASKFWAVVSNAICCIGKTRQGRAYSMIWSKNRYVHTGWCRVLDLRSSTVGNLQITSFHKSPPQNPIGQTLHLCCWCHQCPWINASVHEWTSISCSRIGRFHINESTPRKAWNPCAWATKLLTWSSWRQKRRAGSWSLPRFHWMLETEKAIQRWQWFQRYSAKPKLVWNRVIGIGLVQFEAQTSLYQFTLIVQLVSLRISKWRLAKITLPW